jgi:broad specificity phosphatase PhoE
MNSFLLIGGIGVAVLGGGAAKIQAQAPLQAVIVVRHAEKATTPKENPPLNPAGEARAKALLEALRDAGLTTIITTDQQRTRMTAAPLFGALHMQAQTVPRTEKPEADARAIAAAVRKAGGTVLVVSHQLTIPHIIAELGGPAMPTMCDVEFSNLYVLLPAAAGGVRLIRGHYGAPDPPHTADCRVTPVSPP